MSANPWCFDPANDKLSKLEEAAAAYKAEFENLHDKITQDEWDQIVEPMDLIGNSQKEYLDKPPAATSGFWWESTDPNCWAAQRNVYSSYDISPEMKEISRLLTQGRNLDVKTTSSASGGTTFVSSYGSEIDGIIDSFASGGWKNSTYLEIAQAISFFAQPPGGTNPTPAITSASGGSNGDLVKLFKRIEDKLGVLRCPDFDDFKSQYTTAVIEISKKLKDIEERIAEEERKRKDPSYAVANAMSWGNLERERKKKLEALRLLDEAIEGDIKEEIEEAFADNIAYTQQCILLSFMGNLVAAKKQRDRNFGKTSLPYRGETKTTNAPIRMLGEPFGFVNRLVVEPSQRRFFSIPNQVLSSLGTSYSIF